MYDPYKANDKPVLEDAEGDDEDDNEKGKNYDDEQRTEIMQKYGKYAKFHLIIQQDGQLGKPLPHIINLENPLPNEPPCMKKRSGPKALRYYKAKNDRDPSRVFLHELMLYKNFNKDTYGHWCSDGSVCTSEYQEHAENILNVKEKIMEWISNVEEARLLVEEIMNNNVDTDAIGEEIDAEKELEILDCLEEGDEEDPTYKHLNPDGMFDSSSMNTLGNKLCKQIQLEEMKILVERTQKLYEDQRNALDIAIKFARDTVKTAKSACHVPIVPKMIITGGAGAGKSTLINVLSQWMVHIFQKPGDDPESPYVVKTATTGAASLLIDGITLHSAMGFDFSNKHTSLSDKKRELRREQMKNTKVIIVDEFSLLKPDLLYRLDLALREIKHNNKEFGGCLVALMGDLLQVIENLNIQQYYTFFI